MSCLPVADKSEASSKDVASKKTKSALKATPQQFKTPDPKATTTDIVIDEAEETRSELIFFSNLSFSYS